MLASLTASLPVPVWLLVLIVLFVIYTISRRRTLRKRLEAKLNSVSDEIDRLNSRYLELAGHMFFESGVQSRLVGDSHASLVAAQGLKSSALTALDTLKQRHAEAKRLSKRRSGLTRTLQNTFRLLSVTPVVVAGKEYPPSTLAEQVNRWFDEASTQLEALSSALRQTSHERAEAGRLTGELRERLAELTESGVRSLELEAAFEALDRDVVSLSDQPVNDPMAMAPQAVAVRCRVDRFAADLDALEQSKDRFTEAFDADRANLERLRCELEGRRIVYAFPLGEGETPPWTERKMPMDELASCLSAADSARERALEALAEGRAGAFTSESGHALRLTGNALKQFKHAGVTREKVDSLAALVKESVSRLAEGVTASGEVLERLASEFGAMDLASLRERYDNASQVSGRALSEFSNAKSFYDGCRFGQALETLQRLSDDIASAENDISSLDASSEELKNARAQVQSTASRHRGAFESLSRKISVSRQVASKETVAALEELERFFAQASGADSDPGWFWASGMCAGLGKAVKQLQSDFEREKNLYENALEKLEQCRDLVKEARRAAGRGSSRRVARDKLSEAVRLLELLELDMETPGSDWAELKKHGDDIVPLAREASRRGNYDEEKFTEAQGCLESAKAKKEALGEYADGVLATGKMLSASKALADAEIAYTDRRFEDAAKLAAQADQSFQGSLNARKMSA